MHRLAVPHDFRPIETGESERGGGSLDQASFKTGRAPWAANRHDAKRKKQNRRNKKSIHGNAVRLLSPKPRRSPLPRPNLRLKKLMQILEVFRADAQAKQ
ncbi:MAG: hypothetical protein R3C40_01500 [Parvularculaceae bacterium]